MFCEGRGFLNGTTWKDEAEGVRVKVSDFKGRDGEGGVMV